jgi:hypothetical protein
MATTTVENPEYIVVHDGVGPDGADLDASPTTVSKDPVTDQARKTPRSSSQRRNDGQWNDSLDPLRALPELRLIPWYQGKELPLHKSTESTRVQTRGASLLASRGEVRDPPCTHCATGVGRFSQCIALDNWFHGACATCQFATRGNLCSLRQNKKVGRFSASANPDAFFLC